MKAFIGLVIVGALALGAMYFYGGYHSFDPDKQGRAAKAAIKPGMSLKQVLAAAGENPKYQAINKIKERVGDREVESVQEGTEVAFNKEKVFERLRSNQMPEGFNLIYRYSEQVAFKVNFDGTGSVTGMEDMITMADLLQTRQK